MASPLKSTHGSRSRKHPAAFFSTLDVVILISDLCPICGMLQGLDELSQHISVHIHERSLDNAVNITRFNNAVNTLCMTDVKERLD